MVDSLKAALERSMVMATVCSSCSYVFTCFKSFSNRIYKDLRHPRYPVTLIKTFLTREYIKGVVQFCFHVLCKNTVFQSMRWSS